MWGICEGCQGTPCICVDDGLDRIPPSRYDFKLEIQKYLDVLDDSWTTAWSCING